MKDLKIVLLHRDNWYRNQARVDGQFAYDVPGLSWVHHPIPKEVNLDLRQFGGFDVIWLDDGKYKPFGIYPDRDARGMARLVYYILYPTLADHLYQDRLEKAKHCADLVLLDHDRLERWQDTRFKTRRLAYSVNDLYYRDRGVVRDIDVGFYCFWGHNLGRRPFEEWLRDFCQRKGYRFYGLNNKGAGTEYPALLARTKVVVHLNRTPQTRPPRIFDASACGAALLSNPMPRVSGESFVDGVHYMSFRQPQDIYQEFGQPRDQYQDSDCEDVIEGLEWLIDEGYWEIQAQEAKTYVLANHTWARRAVELRGILLDVFPHLREIVGDLWMYQT